MPFAENTSLEETGSAATPHGVKKKQVSGGPVLSTPKSRMPAKQNSFAALNDDSDSSDTEAFAKTPVTATPSGSVCEGDSSSESTADSGDVADAGWVDASQRNAAQRRKMRPPRPKPDPDVIVSAAPQPQAEKCEADEYGDDMYFLQKGQRHCHSKAQKQERSFKAKLRLTDAKQKRQSQRERSQLAGLEEGDEN